MEEGNKLVEQLDTVEAHEEVSAPWSVEGLTVPSANHRTSGIANGHLLPTNG